MPEIGEVKKGKELGRAGVYSKYIWSACPDCGKERWVALISNEPKAVRCVNCSRCKGAKHHNWAGGRRAHQDGYSLVKLSKDDFFYPMTQATGYVFEHRLVMAKHLNRCLLLWEVVHHKNGIRDDNQIENLQLLPTQRQHIVDSLTKSRITRLERKVATLEEENQFLHNQLKNIRIY